MAENGKWSLAFWVVTGFLVIIVGAGYNINRTLADNMICNDRLRQEKDTELDRKIEAYRVERYQQFLELSTKTDKSYMDIIQRLSRIEQKLAIK